ncbi:MAG TPA: DUF4339 domain-containing protein [Candidatus Angelobacter sp.]|nr:DUF4339 domain-containing protein [Candidatus Angelobacter sp.]
MKYFIQRELNEYGPYTLADLQRYVAQGSILLTDMTRSEGMTEWVPISQVIGNIPAPGVPSAAQADAPAGSTVHGGGTVYGGTGTVYDGQSSGYGVQTIPSFANTPVPTDLHWALVLLITIFTCFIFSWAWLFVQAAYVRKIKPNSKALLFAILALTVALLNGGYRGYMAVSTGRRIPANPLGSIIVFILVEVALFMMKADLEDYYNTVEPIHLELSGVLTFFCGIFYFQHHLSRIAQWKKSGVLQPQG